MYSLNKYKVKGDAMPRVAVDDNKRMTFASGRSKRRRSCGRRRCGTQT